MTDPLAIALLTAGCDLVDLAARIEERLSVAFRATLKRTPDAPAGHWAALYAEWRDLVPALERLQTAAKAAAVRLEDAP